MKTCRRAKIADDIGTVPTVPDYVMPILTVIPLQLLAYHLAVELGRDVDKAAQSREKRHSRVIGPFRTRTRPAYSGSGSV